MGISNHSMSCLCAVRNFQRFSFIICEQMSDNLPFAPRRLQSFPNCGILEKKKLSGGAYGYLGNNYQNFGRGARARHAGVVRDSDFDSRSQRRQYFGNHSQRVAFRGQLQAAVQPSVPALRQRLCGGSLPRRERRLYRGDGLRRHRYGADGAGGEREARGRSRRAGARGAGASRRGALVDTQGQDPHGGALP